MHLWSFTQLRIIKKSNYNRTVYIHSYCLKVICIVYLLTVNGKLDGTNYKPIWYLPGILYKTANLFHLQFLHWRRFFTSFLIVTYVSAFAQWHSNHQDFIWQTLQSFLQLVWVEKWWWEKTKNIWYTNLRVGEPTSPSAREKICFLVDSQAVLNALASVLSMTSSLFYGCYQ